MIHALRATNVSPHLLIQGWDRIATSEGADAFKNLLRDSLRELGAGGRSAEAATGPAAGAAAADGGGLRAAETLSAMSQTDAALGVMIQIQDRLLHAYHEVQDIRV